MQKNKNKKLIELAKEAYPALRKLIIYGLVAAIGLSAFITDGRWCINHQIV